MVGAVGALALGGEARGEPAKRAVPDLGGAIEPVGRVGWTAGEVAAGVVYPAHVVLEHVVRRPLGALVTRAEKEKWPAKLIDFFLTDDRDGGVVPTALLDFGMRPSVGLYAWKNHLGARDNLLKAEVGTWGASWINVNVVDQYGAPGRTRIAMHAAWTHRPDQIFHGIGPRSSPDDRGRYGIDRLDVHPKLTVPLGAHGHLGLKAGVRAAWFRDDACCGDPRLVERVAAGRYALPPGYAAGYTALYHQLELTLDSRRARPAPGTGLRFDGFAEQAVDARSGGEAGWLRYGGTAGAFVDVDGHARVLGLVVSALFADPIRGEIPFTELVMLGGANDLRGFLPGRLIGRSSLVTTLRYQWPVWASADATLHVAMGDVFGAHLEGLSPGLMRLSSGFGLRSSGTPDRFVELMVGVGTEPLDQGAQVSSVRVYFGGTRGF